MICPVRSSLYEEVILGCADDLKSSRVSFLVALTLCLMRGAIIKFEGREKYSLNWLKRRSLPTSATQVNVSPSVLKPMRAIT